MNIQEPGCKTVCLNRAKPRSPVLPSCLGMPVAVIQGFHVDALLLQLPALLPACPSSAWHLSHLPSVMPSMGAPSSLVQFPTLRKNVPTTCSLGSRSSKAAALSLWISGTPLPPSKLASSLAIDPGSFMGHFWWSTLCTATTSAPPGVHRARSLLRCHSTSGFLDWNRGNSKIKS